MNVKRLKIIFLLLSLGAAGASADLGPRPEINPQDVHQGDFESMRDRLATSLMFRGELADKIIEAGMTGDLIVLEGDSTYSAARLALLDWIRRNPDKAARLALNLRNGVKVDRTPVQYNISTWEINAGFLEKVKALGAAAKDGRVSPEMLELAAKRVYEGSPDGDGSTAVLGGGRQSGGTDFFSGSYADYKLNQAGLARELAGAGGLLDSMRGPGGKGPEGAERAYSGALARYGDFVVSASALKGRSVITGAESEALEKRRAGLRCSLAALAMRRRVADLRSIYLELARDRARPGCRALMAAAGEAAAGCEAAAASLEKGDLPFREISALARSSEADFSAFYIKYSVYSGLLGLKKRSEGLGFSCVYDYLLWRWLAHFTPDAPYVKARAASAAAAAGLDDAMEKTGEGDVEAALAGAGGRAGEIGAALALAREASAANRAAQFFLWGIIFRPLEIEVYARAGRPYYQPAFTFYSVTGPRGGRARE